jgi:hypothetical protein
MFKLVNVENAIRARTTSLAMMEKKLAKGQQEITANETQF